MVHDGPMVVADAAVVDPAHKMQLRVIRYLHGHISALAIELQKQYVEVPWIGHIHTLINPTFQYLYMTGEQLMEREILVTLALGVEPRKTFSGYDIAFEGSYLTFV